MANPYVEHPGRTLLPKTGWPLLVGPGKCPSCMIKDCVACWGRGCECKHDD